MVVPATAVVGAMVLSSGASANTLNDSVLLVLPTPAVVTEMLCAPSGALPAIWSDALTVVKLLLMSEPETRVTPAGRFNVAPIRPVPEMLTGTVAPVPPVPGVMLAIAGIGPVIVNVTAL